MLGKNTSHHKFLALLCANQQHRATVMVLRSVRPSVRPSSIRHPYILFFQKPSSESTPNLTESYRFTIPPDHFVVLIFTNFTFLSLFFCDMFSFSLTWDHMGGKSTRRHFLWKYTSDYPPPPKKISCILLQRFSTKVVEIIVTFETLNFESFSFVGRLTW